MNQLPYANDVNNKLDNIKDLNIESKYYNENKKTGYIMGKAKNNKLQLNKKINLEKIHKKVQTDN